MERTAQRTGVEERRIAGTDETSLDLAIRACEALFDVHPALLDRVDGILFCTQSPDYIMPPNACLLHRHFRLRNEVVAMDFNLACSGYVYGLALANGLLRAGTCHDVLLVTAETYSKFISPDDRAVRTLFGDGAAVSWITDQGDRCELLDVVCATSGEGYEHFMIPAGGCRMPRSEATARPVPDENGNVRNLEQIHMHGLEVMRFVNSKVPPQVESLLARNELSKGDIDLYVFHQASQTALESLTRILELDPEKVFNNLRSIGNTVSASIPIALREALEGSALRPGDRVLLCGFGVGLSWGSALLRV
jgi:3-oxoacyl-[acyl-carrier-protein] synthase-3